MANKYTTQKILEGYKTLDLNKYLKNQQDKLQEVRNEFGTPNANGAIIDKTESAFFNTKDREIIQQQKFIERWVKSMGIQEEHIGNLEIILMVSEEETA